MTAVDMLDTIPLGGLFVTILLLVLLAEEGGYRLGQYRRSRSNKEREAPVGVMVGTTLGLLAFLLAFTFGLAAARFDTKRQWLLDEANAIGTCFLRAEMLPGGGKEVRSLLRTYVDVRLETARTGNLEGLRRSEEIQQQLWAHAVTVAASNPDPIVAIFVQSLNEVIDLHAKRIEAALRSRIPGAIWLTLYAVSMLSFAGMGYHSGLTGTTRSLAILGVAIAFCSVIWLIADLDRPLEGTLEVNQQTMIDLQKSMAGPVK